jgi:hypothetical protein
MTENYHEKPEEYKFKKPEKIALIFAASPLILLFLISFVVATINGTWGNKECAWKQEYLNLNFTGSVKIKGLDIDNHGYPFIEIVSPVNKIDHIFLIEKKSELWDKIEANDYIIKQKGTLDFNVTRDTVHLILTPSFDCGLNDFWITSKKYPGLF